MATQTESYLNFSTQPAADDIWPLFLDQNIVTHESCMVTWSWHAHVEQSEIVLSGCIQEIAIPVWTQARDNSYSCDGQMPPRKDAAGYDQRNNWSAISWTVSCKLCYLSERCICGLGHLGPPHLSQSLLWLPCVGIFTNLHSYLRHDILTSPPPPYTGIRFSFKLFMEKVEQWNYNGEDSWAF